MNKEFIVSGSGKPLRQFIHSNDLAKIIIWLLDNENYNESLIISPDEKDEISIGKIAELIAKEFDYIHNLKYNLEKSDGQYRKTADNSKLKKLYGELEFINIEDGIKETINRFKKNYHMCRK